MKQLSKIKPQKLAMAVIVGCFMTFVAYFSSQPSFLSVPPSPTGDDVAEVSSIKQLEKKNQTMMQVLKSNTAMPGERNQIAIDDQTSQIAIQEETNQTNMEQLKSQVVMQEGRNESTIEEPKTENVIQEAREEAMKEEVIPKIEMPKAKITCDITNPRTEVCEMEGDIRIHAQSSSIFVINPQSDREEQWKLKPHPRKGMPGVRYMIVKSVTGDEAVHSCTISSGVPAIVFSTGGFMGNTFHDFTDAIIPLFQTAHQFNGEVQLIISSMPDWWTSKYELLLKHISKYEIIEFDKLDRVLCYRHVIVGLRSTREMSIDPSRAPNGYSMVDFGKFMRNAYSLKRQAAITLPDATGKKPRLLIISRKKSRRFKNVKQIARMAEELGYEVIVREPKFTDKADKFGRIVNSCDVMVGVHGAGLTNFVFLPMNAILIQVVPFGLLEDIAWGDFGEGASDMKLRYLQYRITEGESTLLQQYPRDHPVFADPSSVHRQGWNAMTAVYLSKQSVKLDVGSFRTALLHALKLLEE